MFVGTSQKLALAGGNYGKSTGFTTQHADKESLGYLAGLEASKIDNIYTRNDVYNSYLGDLDETISKLYGLEIGFNHSIHDYVMKKGVTKDNNILLFKNYAEMKGKDVKSFMFDNKKSADLWTGYLQGVGTKYKLEKIDIKVKDADGRVKNRQTLYKVNITN